MTDITSPDAQTRAAVLESVRVRAELCLSRCSSPDNAPLIERAMRYQHMYSTGTAPARLCKRAGVATMLAGHDQRGGA